MKALYLLLVLSMLVIIQGFEGEDQGEPCCKGHGGGGWCWYELTISSSTGYPAWGNHGHMTCNDKDENGYNYQCPEECK